MSKKGKNQTGQSMLEYMIISALIGIFCLSAFSSFGEKINERVKNMKQKISAEQLKLN
jgi:hypothetical protein